MKQMTSFASCLLIAVFLFSSCKKDSPSPINNNNNNNPTPDSVALQVDDKYEFHFWGNSTLNQSGHALQIEAGTWTYSGDEMYVRGALGFDLQSIPSTATIVDAKLSLFSTPDPLDGDLVHANFGSDNSFFIRRITDDWAPAGASWINQPATTTANEILIPHTDDPFLDLIDIDVTTLINDIRSSTNRGLMISLQNEVYYNNRQFCSSIHADATKHPVLKIRYQ